MQVKAELNYLRISPRKVRLVANLIKGMGVQEAQNKLNFLSKRASGPLLKLLNSVIANAKNNFSLDEKNLYIKSILVNAGPSLKRFQPRARGAAFEILKRTSKIKILLEEIEPTKSKKEKPKKEEIITKKVSDLEDAQLKEEIKKQGKRVDKKQQKKPSKGFLKRLFARKVG